MTEFIKVTEQPSHYRNLEKMSVRQLLTNLNKEDKTVPLAIENALPQIEQLILAIADKMLAGGRLFYIGAGTSGRLGVLDASECPPTFGVSSNLVIGIIAGGDDALRNPVEQSEDDPLQGMKDLEQFEISEKDFVVGIAASGTTPYTIGAVKQCREKGIGTGAIVCNAGSPLAVSVDYPVEVMVGPEFITGSTRLKSGTAQKLVLNMISTTAMIMLGRVEDNRMVHMQLTNEKLVDRGTKMLMETIGVKDYEKAKAMLLQYGSVKKAADAWGMKA